MAPVPPEEKRIVPEAPPEGIANEEAANLEATAMAQGRLNQHKRDDRLHGHVHLATVCFVWMYFVAMASMGAAWLWHLILPEHLRFLNEAQLDKLQTALFSAIGSSAITDRAKKLYKGSQD